MRSLVRIQSELADNARPTGPVPQRVKPGAETSRDGRRQTFPESVTIDTASALTGFLYGGFTSPSISPPTAGLSAHRDPESPKTSKCGARDGKCVIFPNEVNLTSDKYGASETRKAKIEKSVFSKRPQFGIERKSVPVDPKDPAILSRARPPVTLFLYVSDPRRPASPPSPSGDQCAAGPGLIRFCKSNERMPAAVPAGFFISPVRLLAGLRS
jgi:hypothetical protein